MSKHVVNAQLAGIHGRWSHTGSTLTIQNYDQMEKVLDEAQKYFIQVSVFFLSLFMKVDVLWSTSLNQPQLKWSIIMKFDVLTLNIVLHGKS